MAPIGNLLSSLPTKFRTPILTPCSPLSSLPTSPCEPSPRRRARFPRGGRVPCGVVFCSDKQNGGRGFLEEFSVLPKTVVWNNGDTWTTFAAYFFILHVPLSFGGLSIISQIIRQPKLDPLAEAISILLLQIMELVGTLLLLQNTAGTYQNTAGTYHSLSSFFSFQYAFEGRGWVKASAVGTGFLIILVLLTSFIADQLFGSKEVNNPELQEILVESPASKYVFSVIYCLVTPLLEEIIYRGVLLTSLASTMKWHHAVIASSFVFSLAHLSIGNAVQLFLVGSVLGSVYCWSGNLVSPFVVHAAYNAAILAITIYA